MIDVKTFMEQLTGQNLTDSLVEFLEQHCEDFSEIRKKYRKTIARTEKGEALANAIAAQTASDLLFAAALGLKANLHHFRDPIARTFLEVDSEIYLRESAAHSLPQYIEAQKLRNTVETNDDIIAYTTYDDDKKGKGKKVRVDIYYTAIGLTHIPSEEEIMAAIKNIE